MSAPTYSTYPIAEEVEAHLRSTGTWPEDSEGSNDPTNEQLHAQTQAEIAINWVIAEWERRVNWLPFLAASTRVEERVFDTISSGGYINLEGGVLTVSTLSIEGEVLVAGTDYRLEPRNADKQGRPFEEIRLHGRRHRYLRDLGQIVVAGRWGYTATVPADVYGALIETAARIVLTHIENEQNISELSQDGFTKAFDIVGTITQKDLVSIWERTFQGMWKGYQRVVL